MKKAFGVALLALPLLAVPGRAQNQFVWIHGGQRFAFRMEGNVRFSGGTGPAMQAGPWYLYWPFEAHFNAPAPTGYPYWPPNQMLVTNVPIGGPAAPPCAPALVPPVPATTTAPTAPAPAATPPAAAPTVQPTSYTQMQTRGYLQPYYGQGPSYWYDR